MVGVRLVSAAMLVVGLTLMLTAPCAAEESVASSSLLNKKHHSHHGGGAFVPGNTSSKKKTIHKVESRIAAVTKELEERIFLANADSPDYDLPKARSLYGVQVENIIASAPNDVVATKFWVHCRDTTIKLARIFGGKHCGMVIKLAFPPKFFDNGDGEPRTVRLKAAMDRVENEVDGSCGPRRGLEFALAAEEKRVAYCSEDRQGSPCNPRVDWGEICGNNDIKKEYIRMEAIAQTPTDPYLLFVDLGYAGVFYGKFVGGKAGALGHIDGYRALDNSGIMDTLVRRVKDNGIGDDLSDYKDLARERRIYDIIDKPGGFDVGAAISERDVMRFILRFNAMRPVYSVARCNCLLLVAALHQYLTTGNAAQLAIGGPSRKAIEPSLNRFVSFIREIMSSLNGCEGNLVANHDGDGTLDHDNIRGWR